MAMDVRRYRRQCPNHMNAGMIATKTNQKIEIRKKMVSRFAVSCLVGGAGAGLTQHLPNRKVIKRSASKTGADPSAIWGSGAH